MKLFHSNNLEIRARPAGSLLFLALACFTTGCGDDVRPIAVQSDGERVTVVRKSGEKQVVESDGRRVATVDAIRGLQHAPDGTAVFAAKSGDGWQVMRGDKAVGKKYGWVGDVTVSSQGSVAFVAKQNDGWRVVRDGTTVGGAYEEITGLSFGPDGRSVAVTAVQGGQPVLIRNGTPNVLNYEWVGDPRFDRTGESVFCLAGTTGGAVLVRDGQPITNAYPIIDSWSLSPDGRSVALVAKEEGDVERSFSVVRDHSQVGQPFTKHKAVTQPVFSPKGDAIAYAVHREEGGWTVYRDAVPQGNSVDAAVVSDLIFSPDGRSVAFLMLRRGRWYVGRNGRTISEGFDRIMNFRNGPDGRALRFSGLRGQTTGEVEILW
jgi:hypothetical protein